jgi:hypothetical protein
MGSELILGRNQHQLCGIDVSAGIFGWVMGGELIPGIEQEPSLESSRHVPYLLIFKAGIEYILKSSLPFPKINSTTE